MWVLDSLDFQTFSSTGQQWNESKNIDVIYSTLNFIWNIHTKSLGKVFPHSTLLYNVEFCNHCYIKFKYITETLAFLLLCNASCSVVPIQSTATTTNKLFYSLAL